MMTVMRRRKTGAIAIRRRGFALIEIAVAVLLLAIAMTMTVRLLGWTASERRAAERRHWAAQEVSNRMERLTALPWDRITPDCPVAKTLARDASTTLPGGELAVNVDEQPASNAKRIAVRLRWRNRAGEWDAPVRLTAWVHRNGRSAR